MRQSTPRVGGPSRANSDRGERGETRSETDGVETEKSLATNTTGAPDAGSEITYLYLTFDKQLPTANITITKASSPSAGPRPPEPDLAPYMNPMLWPSRRKNVVLVLSCVATFLTAYTAGVYSPPTQLIKQDLGATSDTSVRAGITTFCVGFATAPMILAPFSEIIGRYPVFAVSGVLYVIFQAVCGVVTNLAGMLIARLIVGIGGSVFSTMVGGVIADLWSKEDRNMPMALFSCAALAGTGAGPLVGSVITYRLAGVGGPGLAAAWKWVFWHQVISGALLVLVLVLIFKESRGSVVLSRKARALNKWYEELEEAGHYGVWVEDGGPGPPQSATTEDAVSGQGNTIVQEPCEEKGPSPVESRRDSSVSNTKLVRIRWLVKDDEERSSIGKMISISIYRPFHLLITEPVVFFFSLWVSFAWTVLYLTFGSIPLVFGRQYGWNTEEAGWVFAAMIVGAILATFIALWQEHILHHPKWQVEQEDTGVSSAAKPSRFWSFMRRNFPPNAPEARLYSTCVTATLLPIGLFMFGFTARPEIHWIAPTIAIALATMGIYSIYLAVFNYFADTYHKYASSALAAQSFCRNTLGGAFPLVTAALFTNLGEQRAGGLLGSIGTALTVVPWVLVFFGEKIRARSRFASVRVYIGAPSCVKLNHLSGATKLTMLKELQNS